jgi:phosphatidylglycerophosphate synthase
MSRNGNLTEKELEHIKTFRYKTNGLTPLEIHVYEPFWNFLANKCLPDWLAPNALTLLGAVVPLASLATICSLDCSFSEKLPCWVWLLSWFAQFWYQTIDAIDGKQARRTNNCSPLGQILDHNLDQVTLTCIMVSACSMLQVGDDCWKIILLTPGLLSAHYSIEYRTHFTKMHQTVVAMMGATEQILLVQAFTLLSFFISTDYLSQEVTVPVVEARIKIEDLAVMFAFSSGFFYNTMNIGVAFFEAKEPGYALGCMVPYAQFLAMMFYSSYSQLYKDYCALFVVLCGFYLTWVTAIFNLNSTANAKFNWVFFEPCFYLAFVYCDHLRIFDRNLASLAYVSFFCVTLVRYLVLMTNIVNQITAFMGLRFLKVKPVAAKPTKNE